jgi:hypothetical protein
MKNRGIWICTIFSAVLYTASVFASDFVFYPGADYSDEIPTMEQVVGHKWGEQISSYNEIEEYLEALSNASPKVMLRSYGKTWEGRTLYYLVISSPENLARLDEIRNGVASLAKVEVSPDQSNQLIGSLPAIVWLAYGVHGNEISSPDAALLTAYHLAASKNDEIVSQILTDSIVILDPQQNPDGRDRFVNYFRQTTGAWPDPDPASAEHNEVWPGGRVNHYLFDMNRDWTALTQLETRGRIKAYREWYPQVFADLHEMGGNSTYYFAPPADPLNPVLTDNQKSWLNDFGQNNARWFDQMGFDYFTREVFDSFFPGYGESWPMFQGSIGMTYEQASVRGLILQRDDETEMHFRESVHHHFIASLSTLEFSAKNREKLVKYFADYRRTTKEEGSFQGVREFILSKGNDPNRTIKLVNLLLEQGIEVRKANSAIKNSQVKGEDGNPVEMDFESGSFIVGMNQPSAKLAWTMLAKNTPMDDEFVQEQIRRREKGQREQFYDVTGWSLPVYYGVPCYEAGVQSTGDTDLLNQAIPLAGGIEGGKKAQLAYLVKWDSNSSAQLLAAALRSGVRVHSSDKPFSIGGQDFPSGSLIIKVKDNPEDLFEMLSEFGREFGVSLYPTDSAWVDSGVNFGSNNVVFLKKPRILMAYHMPTRSSSVGATRYILEQMYGYPVTLVHSMELPGVDFSKYNVLILPESGRFGGGYTGIFGERGLSRIKDWIQGGGTLIALGSATEWLTEEKVGLLQVKTEFKETEQKKPAEKDEGAAEKEEQYDDVKMVIQPERQRPGFIPGAMVKVSLDTEHWLAFGYPEQISVLVNSNRVFPPLKLDQGTNVAMYGKEEDLVVSGFTWEDSRKQLAQKAYLMHRRSGRGNVIGFAEDPNFRAYLDGLNLLFMNGVLFGPSR